MTQTITLHPEDPQPRLLQKVADIIANNGIIIYPTDSCYALGCSLENREGLEQIKRIRQLKDKHEFSIICKDISQISNYARISNPVFRLIKNNTPGPYTFILPATNEIPKRLKHPKRKTIGVRIPQHKVTQELLNIYNAPIMSTTLQLPNDDIAMFDPDEIQNDKIMKQIDLFVRAQICSREYTTIIDLEDGYPKIIREGLGDIEPFT